MSSTFPATLCPDSYPYPDFSLGGFSPWEETDNPDFLLQDPASPPEPISSNSGSDTLTPSPLTPTDEPNRKRTKPGSAELDERKRRRMVSNRESARRSRMRKQRHLENLRNRWVSLRTGNRDLTNKLQFLAQQNQIVRTQNELLRSEAAALRQRLWDIRQVLLVRQLQHHLNPNLAWQRNNVTAMNDGLLMNHSLIT